MRHLPDDPADVVRALVSSGVERGGLVALAVGSTCAGLAVGDERFAVATHAPVGLVSDIEEALHPRWLWWDQRTAAALIEHGCRPATCWDVAAVHRLLFGGWRADPARVWAVVHDLDPRQGPSLGQLDLLAGGDAGGDPASPVQPDGYLRPEWLDGGWARDPEAAATWAACVLEVWRLQRERLDSLAESGEVHGSLESTLRSESAAELLCAELASDGLPVVHDIAESLLCEIIGSRPHNEADAAQQRAVRDELVLRHLPPGSGIDLRKPADVKSYLRRQGIDVPDTRAWRLEALRDNPAVDDLLRWRKAERIATTFGYGWIDTHVGSDGRLRGAWAGSDGAAGRMTAQAGLHNLPAELRPIVVADPDHVFVRADLGQIEPRVLAAVSGDTALQAATADDDLYAPVATRLGVERSVAKVAVLAAMYGQTSGNAGQALRGMEAAYPVAVGHLAAAARAGEEGRTLRTWGGRLIRMYDIEDASDHRAAAAGRGRYARNAVIQGAAAELFKMWAVTVRARSAGLDARIVLCLHDELLVHVPAANGDEVASLLHACLAEAAHRWQRVSSVRFVADVSVMTSWAEAH